MPGPAVVVDDVSKTFLLPKERAPIVVCALGCWIFDRSAPSIAEEL